MELAAVTDGVGNMPSQREHLTGELIQAAARYVPGPQRTKIGRLASRGRRVEFFVSGWTISPGRDP